MTEEAAYVCSHIFDDAQPVLLVAREDGEWMFLCGALHDDEEQYHVVGMNHLLARDLTLREVLDLPDNWEAQRRRVGDTWSREPLSD